MAIERDFGVMACVVKLEVTIMKTLGGKLFEQKDELLEDLYFA
jgi:hypothetical protein